MEHFKGYNRQMFGKYDVIVVGGGHAGCEAATAAAKMGASVLLITMDLRNLAYMSCNPAMGGIAKGQILREIDALGGMSGIVSDLTTIQFRMLNLSKGPAMWSPRSQNDRIKFSLKWKEIIESIDNIHLWQDTVVEVVAKNDQVKSVITGLGIEIQTNTCIITSGTFLNGRIFIGKKSFESGRLGEKASKGLTESIKKLGIESDKLKTGTSVRLDGRSIDFSRLVEQKGDEEPGRFSFTDTPRPDHQKSCYLTYTNPEVHDILRSGFKDSPLYHGMISGSGPRYCPSIEDKLIKFEEKERHQIFLEPEGWNTYEYYINGFSSSLPGDIQYSALKKVEGLKNARILKPGYGIEYDYFPPTQLTYSLESEIIHNLFFAGQVNGTTGYEEAACQGLIAGINSVKSIRGEEPLVLKRSEAYIGVLIDDLVNKGTNEPYRMFTSRAEYRLLLRQHNADIRLTPIGYDIGLCDKHRYELVQKKNHAIQEIIRYLKNNKVEGGHINEFLSNVNSSPLKVKTSLYHILKRPQLNIFQLSDQFDDLRHVIDNQDLRHLEDETMEEVEILVKYEGYIEKEQDIVDKIQRLENLTLSKDFDYMNLKGLSYEARQKLQKIKPQNIGQASRISGISPADISVLLVYLKR